VCAIIVAYMRACEGVCTRCTVVLSATSSVVK